MLKSKALASLVASIEAFNSTRDDGRATKVLLHLQHAFEMLLKAALVQSKLNVFDPKLGRSLGFETCVKQAQAHRRIKLSDADAGTLRAIDAMRDDEQHWFSIVSEQILYLHVRAAVTLFDDLLQRVFKERLADHLPDRVLPVTTNPPRDLSLVLDEEYTQIATLLQPGRRKGHEAHARIRTLLALEAHVEPETVVSTKDVERVARGIRSGDDRSTVFPKLDDVATAVNGTGLAITVRFTKSGSAPAVRYAADESVPAAAIREVDLQRKFHRSPSSLATDLKLTGPRSTALRQHLGIDTDLNCRHVFVFGSQKHPAYSDNAFTKMRAAIETLDMDAIWQAHKPLGRTKSRPMCTLPGCAGTATGQRN